MRLEKHLKLPCWPPLPPPWTPTVRRWLAVLDKYRLSLKRTPRENHWTWWREEGWRDDVETGCFPQWFGSLHMASCDPPYQPNGPGLGSQNKVSAEQPTQFKRFYAAAHPLPLISEIVAKNQGRQILGNRQDLCLRCSCARGKWKPRQSREFKSTSHFEAFSSGRRWWWWKWWWWRRRRRWRWWWWLPRLVIVMMIGKVEVQSKQKGDWRPVAFVQSDPHDPRSDLDWTIIVKLWWELW